MQQIFRVLGGAYHSKIPNLYGSIYGQDVQSDVSQGAQSTGIIDKFANTRAAGRQLLISPDPYNILVAFDPTMQFMDRVEDTISSVCRL